MDGADAPTRILILMSDTGGGHRASAQALVDAFDAQFPGRFECDVVDIWTDHAAWPLNKFVPWYQFLARNPFLWRTLWCSNRPLPTAIEISNAACFSRSAASVSSTAWRSRAASSLDRSASPFSTTDRMYALRALKSWR
mgnify:CR=1 FL=1